MRRRWLQQIARSGGRRFGIEAHKRKLRAVMRGVDANGASKRGFPITGQASGFVNVAVKSEERLTMLDESSNGDAADVDIEFDVLE